MEEQIAAISRRHTRVGRIGAEVIDLVQAGASRGLSDANVPKVQLYDGWEGGVVLYIYKSSL